jgi:hypothetical protein
MDAVLSEEFEVEGTKSAEAVHVLEGAEGRRIELENGRATSRSMACQRDNASSSSRAVI